MVQTRWLGEFFLSLEKSGRDLGELFFFLLEGTTKKAFWAVFVGAIFLKTTLLQAVFIKMTLIQAVLTKKMFKLEPF